MSTRASDNNGVKSARQRSSPPVHYIVFVCVIEVQAWRPRCLQYLRAAAERIPGAATTLSQWIGLISTELLLASYFSTSLSINTFTLQLTSLQTYCHHRSPLHILSKLAASGSPRHGAPTKRGTPRQKSHRRYDQRRRLTWYERLRPSSRQKVTRPRL